MVTHESENDGFLLEEEHSALLTASDQTGFSGVSKTFCRLDQVAPTSPHLHKKHTKKGMPIGKGFGSSNFLRCKLPSLITKKAFVTALLKITLSHGLDEMGPGLQKLMSQHVC